jgi:Mlc titration factor MtfA (ptsG expression regulator)
MRFRRTGLPDAGPGLIARHLAVWPLLSRDEQQRLLEITDELLSRKRWEAARGFQLDDRIRSVTAAQAALPVLELDTDHYRYVSSIIIHPTTVRTYGLTQGPSLGTVNAEPVDVLGLAQAGRGPVVLAWDQSLAGARRLQPGHNVVLHEFAHKLDMRDGVTDGTPLLRPDIRRDWARVCTDVYQDLVAGIPRYPMRWYGATNPGEFFAVATEVFFDQPKDLAVFEPDLYDVLSRFYRQNPALRERDPDPGVPEAMPFPAGA